MSQNLLPASSDDYNRLFEQAIKDILGVSPADEHKLAARLQELYTPSSAELPESDGKSVHPYSSPRGASLSYAINNRADFEKRVKGLQPLDPNAAGMPPDSLDEYKQEAVKA